MSEQRHPADPRPSVTTGAAARVAGAAEPPRTHVLIVDDHAPSRIICAGYCDLFDHTSETARSASEAVAAMKRTHFDVVVMNVHMPDTNGLDTLAAIRDLPTPAAETPIIGLAAPARGDETQRWLAAGLHGLLAKPVTASRFFAALQTAIETPPSSARSWAPAVG